MDRIAVDGFLALARTPSEMTGQMIAFVVHQVHETHAKTVQSIGHGLNPADLAFALDPAGFDLKVEHQMFAGIHFTERAEARAVDANVFSQSTVLKRIVMKGKPRAYRLVIPLKTPPFFPGSVHCSSPIKNT